MNLGLFLFDNTTTYSALNHSSPSFGRTDSTLTTLMSSIPTPADSTDEGDVSIVTVDDGAIRGRLDLWVRDGVGNIAIPWLIQFA